MIVALIVLELYDKLSKRHLVNFKFCRSVVCLIFLKIITWTAFSPIIIDNMSFEVNSKNHEKSRLSTQIENLIKRSCRKNTWNYNYLYK